MPDLTSAKRARAALAVPSEQEVILLRAVAKAALDLSTAMVDREQGDEFDAIDSEWETLTEKLEALREFTQ